MSETAELYFDGSSLGLGRRGGPGASAGAAILILGAEDIHEIAIYLPKAHSDEAEFSGLIEGLKLALTKGVAALRIYGDSRNVIDAMTGRKVLRKSELTALQDEASALIAKFASAQFHWIPRHKNEQADELARRRLESGPGT